jgi:hypothetical protein
MKQSMNFVPRGGFSQNVPTTAKAETGQVGKGRHFHWGNFQNAEIIFILNFLYDF